MKSNLAKDFQTEKEHKTRLNDIGLSRQFNHKAKAEHFE